MEGTCPNRDLAKIQQRPQMLGASPSPSSISLGNRTPKGTPKLCVRDPSLLQVYSSPCLDGINSQFGKSRGPRGLLPQSAGVWSAGPRRVHEW